MEGNFDSNVDNVEIVGILVMFWLSEEDQARVLVSCIYMFIGAGIPLSCRKNDSINSVYFGVCRRSVMSVFGSCKCLLAGTGGSDHSKERFPSRSELIIPRYIESRHVLVRKWSTVFDLDCFGARSNIAQ
eukprot:10756971-Karenia_brevis.AAC.1